MINTLRVLISLLSFITAPTHPDRGTAPGVVVTGATPAERRLVDQTMAIFDDAGLTLPPLEIRRYHDARDCRGRQGWHYTIGERSVIHICTAETGVHEQRTLIHELAHAWSDHFLRPDRRTAFERLRGVTWIDDGHGKWEDAGAEQASEIIVWALSPQPVVPDVHFTSCFELHHAYLVLTGRPPLHDDTTLCAPPSGKIFRS